MDRLTTFALAAATLAAGALVLATTSMLPDPVATHFARGGRANDWMTRAGYVVFALSFCVLLPWVVFAIAGIVAPRHPRWSRGREHWSRPEHRDATKAAMRTLAASTGILLALLAAAMHVLLIDANAATPARLDERWFFVVMGVFVAGVLAIVVGYARRFPRR